MVKSPKKVIESIDVYDGSSIKELPFPLCIQHRPQMYVGNMDDSGVLTCVREILNNSVDEHLAGHCTHIEIIRDGATSFSIRDNGRGIPFDVVDGKNSLSRIFGTLHAGRNFTVKSLYSTGLNGVGATAVNALSESFEVTSKRGSEQGYIKFEEGYEKDLKVSSKSKALSKPYDKSSTTVKFSLATKFFEPDLEVKDEDVERLIHETAYLNSGLSITYTYNGETKVFLYTNGVRDLLDNTLNENKLLKKSVHLGINTIKDTKIEIAFNYDNGFNPENIKSYCNTIFTSEGGTHVTGFKRSISQKLLAYVNEKKLVKEKVSNDDIYVGLNAVVSVFTFNPKYTSQTKQQLKNTEVMGHVNTYTNKAIDEWLNTNPSEIKLIAAKLDLVAKSRIAQKRALDAIKKDSSSNLLQSLAAPTKFEDCRSNDPTMTELLLVEGE